MQRRTVPNIFEMQVRDPQDPPQGGVHQQRKRDVVRVHKSKDEARDQDAQEIHEPGVFTEKVVQKNSAENHFFDERGEENCVGQVPKWKLHDLLIDGGLVGRTTQNVKAGQYDPKPLDGHHQDEEAHELPEPLARQFGSAKATGVISAQLFIVPPG